jgi:murein DD-endopeptidase MepM/ murein hydrolase activator NlpD
VENVVSVVDRIRAIESRVAPDVPANGFQQALARAADDPAGATSAPRGFRALGAGPASSARAGITLAQMLGRPLASPIPSPLTGGLASPAGVSGPAGIPTGAPLHLPVDARVSSVFGPRTHPVTGTQRLHAGIDLAAPTGTPIGAAAGGTVSFAGVRGGYGNLVIVDHGDGTETRYAHQHTIGVRAGQTVAAGDVLGTVGSTGQSTGPHLHFELRRDGTPVDPAPLLGL